MSAGCLLSPVGGPVLELQQVLLADLAKVAHPS
jgi:hypothetical protein